MSEVAMPPCGLYRTREAVGEVPAGRLVYFHNHGEPGPGIYLPVSWKANRATFSPRGVLLPDPSAVSALEPLEAEGFYRVDEPFHCCDQRCRLFEQDTLVQLGYDGAGNPILFVPELVEGMLAVPERGTRIDLGRIARLRRLKVPTSGAPQHDTDAERSVH